MANITAKTSSNIFYKARCEAATHNEQLSSREGAADYMSIDRGRLYRIESGIAIPYPEEIRLMADLYNAPELENYFCRTMCPLGCEMPKAELANLDRLTVRTLSVFRKIGKTKEMLLDITADGVIDESEKPELDEVVKNLEEVEEIAQSMRLWIKKNELYGNQICHDTDRSFVVWFDEEECKYIELKEIKPIRPNTYDDYELNIKILYGDAED